MHDRFWLIQGQRLISSCSLPLQQCSDAIKRAQLLKERMGLPKVVSTPAAQTLRPPAPQVHTCTVGSASSQEGHATQGSLERQGSLPSQQSPSGRVIGKAISMPAGSGSILRAYAAGALQSPVEEEQEQIPISPKRNVLGKVTRTSTSLVPVCISSL